MIFPGEEDAKRMAEPHTLTFLFTDVEGSTFLWERNPKAMSEALVRYDEILQSTHRPSRPF